MRPHCYRHAVMGFSMTTVLDTCVVDVITYPPHLLLPLLVHPLPPSAAVASSTSHSRTTNVAGNVILR